jgi:hypothetical protein
MINEDWEQRLAAAWAGIDGYPEADFRALIDALVGELPAGDPIGLYERGGAFDSTGHPAEAVRLYQAALAAGLAGPRRRRCVIQLASSLRNLGQPAEGARLLEAELAAGSDELDDAVRAFLALTLVDSGREREAVGVALAALAPHLPRYQRSTANYAAELVGSGGCPGWLRERTRTFPAAALVRAYVYARTHAIGIDRC